MHVDIGTSTWASAVLTIQYWIWCWLSFTSVIKLAEVMSLLGELDGAVAAL